MTHRSLPIQALSFRKYGPSGRYILYLILQDHPFLTKLFLFVLQSYFSIHVFAPRSFDGLNALPSAADAIIQLLVTSDLLCAGVITPPEFCRPFKLREKPVNACPLCWGARNIYDVYGCSSGAIS